MPGGDGVASASAATAASADLTRDLSFKGCRVLRRVLEWSECGGKHLYPAVEGAVTGSKTVGGAALWIIEYDDGVKDELGDKKCISAIKKHLAALGFRVPAKGLHEGDQLWVRHLFGPKNFRWYEARVIKADTSAELFRVRYKDGQEMVIHREEVETRVRMQRDTSSKSTANDPSNDYCLLCSGEGKVLCCSRCPAVVNLKALGLSSAPGGTWYCRLCTRTKQLNAKEKTQRQQEKNRKRKRKDEGDQQEANKHKRLRQQLKDLEKAQLTKGTVIDGRYKGHHLWYPGKISKVRRDGTVDVAYDDGDREQRVSLSCVAVVPSNESEYAPVLAEGSGRLVPRGKPATVQERRWHTQLREGQEREVCMELEAVRQKAADQVAAMRKDFFKVVVAAYNEGRRDRGQVRFFVLATRREPIPIIVVCVCGRPRPAFSRSSPSSR